MGGAGGDRKLGTGCWGLGAGEKKMGSGNADLGAEGKELNSGIQNSGIPHPPEPNPQSPAPNIQRYRLPAEWEPHEATWIGWPHNLTDWPGKFAPIPWVFGEIVRQYLGVTNVLWLGRGIAGDMTAYPQIAQMTQILRLRNQRNLWMPQVYMAFSSRCLIWSTSSPTSTGRSRIISNPWPRKPFSTM